MTRIHHTISLASFLSTVLLAMLLATSTTEGQYINIPGINGPDINLAGFVYVMRMQPHPLSAENLIRHREMFKEKHGDRGEKLVKALGERRYIPRHTPRVV